MLPAFSIVDPDFDTYSEENPQDIRKGESFAAEVINRVMHGRAWPHTLLIWVYDEHGGYYDHVPPPPAVPPDNVEGHSLVGSTTMLQALLRPVVPGMVKNEENLTEGPRRYDRYGFRVPAVLVSPYSRPDYVAARSSTTPPWSSSSSRNGTCQRSPQGTPQRPRRSKCWT
jgi:phospholipase C